MGAEVEAEAEAEIEAEFVADDRSTIPKSPPTISSFNFGSGFLRKLEEQIQAGVSFELESPRGIKFLSLYALRELTMRKNELKALENSLTKQITAMRTEVQSVLRFLEPVGADIPTDNSEPSFWPINSWEKYVQFASSPNEHISTLKSLLRSCKRDKWSDALMAMLNESLSKEMQAVINLIGSDMRSRAVAAGVATNLTDAQLGFQSTLLSHFQKAITFIYGATAEAGRPSEQSVRNTCRQQLKHGGDRLKGRSHRTGSQLLSGVQTQSPASDSAVQRQSLVAATPSPASGSAVQRQSLVAATQSPASGSAVQRQSLVAATPSPLLAAPYKDSLWWQRLQAPLLAAPYKDSLWWQRLKVPLLAAPYKDSLWWQRLKPASGSAVKRQSLVAATPSPASGSAVQRRSLVAATQSPASGSAVQRRSLVAATQSPASGSAVQRRSLVAATQSPASGSAVQRHSHSSSFSLTPSRLSAGEVPPAATAKPSSQSRKRASIQLDSQPRKRNNHRPRSAKSKTNYRTDCSLESDDETESSGSNWSEDQRELDDGQFKIF
uniref:Protein kinase domain-containing protein n=1 Tax=Macrostomum lignano TaxID=282301 RepID=A0A1I8JHE0_9PLAT